MNDRTRDVMRKTMDFSIDIVQFTPSLPNNPAGWTIGKQLVRSATSIGANFREAQYARSRPEFASKIQIALQEAAETQYWLEVIERTRLVETPALSGLRTQADQLTAILTAVSRSTTRSSRHSS